MKQKILLLLMLLTSLAADAWKSDYFDYTYEGVTLRYMLTGNGDCVVVHRSGDIGGAVTIPSKAASYPVTKIGSGAFKGCSSLTSVTIPNSVTEIGADAFNGCSSLTSVTIPGSVTGIGDFSFAYCNSLEKVYYDADEPTATFENVFSDFMKPTLYVKESAIDKIKATVPRIKVMNIEGMESLYELKYSFDYITSTASVTGIKIQAGVDNIDVVIPETTMNGWQVFTVAAISESAFYYCRSLSGQPQKVVEMLKNYPNEKLF